MSKRKLLEGIATIEEQVKIASSNNSRKIKYLLQAPNLSQEAADILVARICNLSKRNKLTQTIFNGYEKLLEVANISSEVRCRLLAVCLIYNVWVGSNRLSQILLEDVKYQKCLPKAYIYAANNRHYSKVHYAYDNIIIRWGNLPRNIMWETYLEAVKENLTDEKCSAVSHSSLAHLMLAMHNEAPFLTKENIELILEKELLQYRPNYSSSRKSNNHEAIEMAKNALLFLDMEEVKQNKTTEMFSQNAYSTNLEVAVENQILAEEFMLLQSKFQTSKFLSENFLKHKGDDFPTDIKTKLTEAETHTQKALSFYETILKVNSSEQTDKALKVAFTQAETAIENYERVVDFIIEAAEVETENDVKIRDSFDDIIVKTRTWSEMKKFELS